MPRVERARVVSYVYASVGEQIGALAGRWGMTVSRCVESLICWGAYALEIEEAVQDCDVGVSALRDALAFDVGPAFGPVEPSRTIERAVDDARRAQLRDIREALRIKPSDHGPASPPYASRLAADENEYLARLIREIVREEMAAQTKTAV